MDLIHVIEEQAKKICPRILFPEADEPMLLKVAQQAAARGIARPVLLGEAGTIRELAGREGICLEGVEIMEPSEEKKAEYAARFVEEQSLMTEKMVLRKLKNPLYYGACAVHFGDADSFIAGYHYTTGEVILAASAYVGIQEQVSTVSSFNLVSVPGFEGSQGEHVIFADVAVCVDPSARQLADIARLSAEAAAKLLGWEPRVAFLSYSTKGSGESGQVEKVQEALRIFSEHNPGILADGEFQLEVALSRQAAEKKLGSAGPVAGRANIIIFPELNSGNTNIKAVKLFSHANSIGPILTGFQKPVSDLSRTGSLKHLLGTVAVVAALCEGRKTTDGGI